jgi:hypothetical protein
MKCRDMKAASVAFPASNDDIVAHDDEEATHLARQLRKQLADAKDRLPKAEEQFAALSSEMEHMTELSILSYLRNPMEVSNVDPTQSRIESVKSKTTRKKMHNAAEIGHWDKHFSENDFSRWWQFAQYFPPRTSRATSPGFLAQCVADLLRGVVTAMGKYSIVTLLNSRVDLSIVETATDRAIGIIKVEMPGPLGENNGIFGAFEHGSLVDGNELSAVAGQLYEQLVSLQMTGLRKPFALLTNWNEWQLVTIEDGRLGLSEGRPSDATIHLTGSARAKRPKSIGGGLVDRFTRPPQQILVSDVVRLKDKGTGHGFNLGKFLEQSIVS